MEMEDQYGIPDLRQYMNARNHFPAIPPPPDLFSGHRNLTETHHHHHHPYDMVMVPRSLHHHEFPSDSTTTTAAAASVEMEVGGGGGFGVDGGGTGRWPRQETLTLLEVRSKLDSKFKEANQKGPLWDEVSRIMSEEHGYQRSGKKCREKFENLYKYYKKTKEGKAGRQDGKHYRFFRQLDALYGDNNTTQPVSASETLLVGNNFEFHNATNNNAQANQECFQAPRLCDSLSLSNSSEFDSSSSDDDNNSTEKKKKRRGRRSWKAKIRDFIDSQMRKLMEKQEELLEKMMKTLERKEQERMSREEEWRAQEAARIEREHKFWANERAWIEARDAALMETLQKVAGKEVKVSSQLQEELMGAELQSLGENLNENGSETITSWPECEITKLMQLRNSMESRFQQTGCSEEVLWEGIAAKMSYLGYDRSGLMCKDKWDSINCLRERKECNKKRRENSKSCCYFQNSESVVHNQGRAYIETNEQGPEITTTTTRVGSNDGNATMHDSCLRFLVGIDGDNMWDNYGLKLSKGENH
ncbi:Trihelix transcription factor PTL [Camellia lanceoleosa]|uniref:Trihelix transcription factor PTL n=1 Tax=Camellia lanceoleosa TaxID=1840588 RepID=A0ACC0HPI2_9ERIC|nr:Trihelix transcription factor PTL [Camellia lanceoleosa]